MSELPRLSGMTEAQASVLLALNVIQMQRCDGPVEDAPWASEIAEFCGRSTRSAAVILSQMRDFGWVESLHFTETIAWRLTGKGVSALERNREALSV
jgi:hypothetical protein